jgi:hypothetical protein
LRLANGPHAALRLVTLFTPMIWLLLPAPAAAETARSHSVTRAFERLHPCPSTGLPRGGCPGYVKDHIVPLACGGADAVANLQWQTVAAAKAKDRWERIGCSVRSRLRPRGSSAG